MPEISSFFGIKITFNYCDHNPPHFHAEYNGMKALVNIIDITILMGKLPKKQLSLVLAWTEIHREELLANWELARNHEELRKIKPLD